ncbi:hypothetical protein [Sphingobium sp. YBL2]|uniref:hypothetical protein n=1 Tax=Sphingobium sp. (strain YBL2) TaxID=484429 RepID=UPI0012EDA452|nr:hypothetical protein [Sphingobium sp. YBL2]
MVELEASGALVRFDADLGASVLEIRRIYLLERVPGQIEQRIEKTGSDRQIEIEPKEQLDGLLADFCEGEEVMAATQFKCLQPKENGIWELKTPDVRVFGWFYEKDCFIVSAVDAKWRILEHGLYNGYISEAVRLRAELFGENAKFVEGTEPDDVISNWC